jgi:hypothetical protein
MATGYTHPVKAGEITTLREALVTSSECGPPDPCMLYDEEAVEGWRWTHPDGREWTELGEHRNYPPMHPLLRDALKGTDE